MRNKKKKEKKDERVLRVKNRYWFFEFYVEQNFGQKHPIYSDSVLQKVYQTTPARKKNRTRMSVNGCVRVCACVFVCMIAFAHRNSVVGIKINGSRAFDKSF